MGRNSRSTVSAMSFHVLDIMPSSNTASIRPALIELTRSPLSALPSAMTLSWRSEHVVLPPQTSKRSEEHTSELQSLMRISYAVFCLKKKNNTTQLEWIHYN